MISPSLTPLSSGMGCKCSLLVMLLPIAVCLGTAGQFCSHKAAHKTVCLSRTSTEAKPNYPGFPMEEESVGTTVLTTVPVLHAKLKRKPSLHYIGEACNCLISQTPKDTASQQATTVGSITTKAVTITFTSRKSTNMPAKLLSLELKRTGKDNQDKTSHVVSETRDLSDFSSHSGKGEVAFHPGS